MLPIWMFTLATLVSKSSAIAFAASDGVAVDEHLNAGDTVFGIVKQELPIGWAG